MKSRIFLATLTLVATLSASAQQQYSFTNTVNMDIPQGNPNGIYSTISIAGIPNFDVVTNVTLSLNISGGFNGDLYGYLSGDNGGFAVLVNRLGRTSSNPVGYGDAGMNVTFSDSAAGDIHNYGGNGGNPLTGTWQPDGRTTDPQQVLDTDPRTAFLSSFNGRDPNGNWTLFFADFANGYQATIVSWSLSFEVIPEPGISALAVVGFGALWLMRRRKYRNAAQ